LRNLTVALAESTSGEFVPSSTPSSIEFWNPPQAVLLAAAPYSIPRDGGDIVTGLAIFTLGLLTIAEPFRRVYLNSIAALALLAVVFDLLGGLYALSAQLGLSASLALL